MLTKLAYSKHEL